MLTWLASPFNWWEVSAKLHLNFYHATWGVLSCGAIQMKLLKPPKMTDNIYTLHTRSLNKWGTLHGQDTIHTYGTKAHPEDSLSTTQKTPRWFFFFTNQVATYYSNSITRLPKFSTHFQQSLYVLLPGQQSKRAFTFIELVKEKESFFKLTVHHFN